MAYKIIKHNNKEVLFIDHRGLTGDDLLNSLKEANKYVLENKKDHLAVADFTDTNATKAVNEYLQSEESKAASKYATKQAVVGMSGIKKMVLRVYMAFTGVKSGIFDTVEEALEYVTKL